MMRNFLCIYMGIIKWEIHLSSVNLYKLDIRGKDGARLYKVSSFLV